MTLRADGVPPGGLKILGVDNAVQVLESRCSIAPSAETTLASRSNAGFKDLYDIEAFDLTPRLTDYRFAAVPRDRYDGVAEWAAFDRTGQPPGDDA